MVPGGLNYDCDIYVVRNRDSVILSTQIGGVNMARGMFVRASCNRAARESSALSTRAGTGGAKGKLAVMSLLFGMFLVIIWIVCLYIVVTIIWIVCLFITI